jgi:hypothetical protein
LRAVGLYLNPPEHALVLSPEASTATPLGCGEEGEENAIEDRAWTRVRVGLAVTLEKTKGSECELAAKRRRNAQANGTLFSSAHHYYQ